MYEFISKKVRKTKNGKPNGDHPAVQSLKTFFEKVDEDFFFLPALL